MTPQISGVPIFFKLYENQIPSTGICLDSRLRELSIESKNAQKKTSDEEVMVIRSWRFT